MDVKKQMLAFIERTNSLPKSHNSTDSSLQYKKLTLRNSPTTPKNSRLDEFKRPKQIRTNSYQSNRSSQQDSPDRFQSPGTRRGDFRTQALKTLNELTKLKATKCKKHLEIEAKEEKILKQLRKQVSEEVKGRKPVNNNAEVQKFNQKIRQIMKQSAEDLLILEDLCKELEEENLRLKDELEKAEEVKVEAKILLKKKKTLQECLEILKEYPQGQRGGGLKDPEIIENYLEKVEKAAEDMVRDVGGEWEQIAYAITGFLLEEKGKREKSVKENAEMMEYERGLRKGLEEKISKLEN